MSRSRSTRHSNNPESHHRHNQLDVFGSRDPFQEMNQVMKSFGGFGGRGMSMFEDDFFKRDSMSIFESPIDRMMNFSDMHKNLHGKGQEGSFVSQTFVSSSKMGPDGKMHQQSYYENSAAQNKGGSTISQKQQAYKDNQGLKQIAEERMLNDKGHKLVKVKRGDMQPEETHHYYNIEEDQARQFHDSWGQKNRELGFEDNVSKHMRGIENGPSGRHRAGEQRQLGLGYGHGFESEPQYHSRPNDYVQSDSNPNKFRDRDYKNSVMGSSHGSNRGGSGYRKY